MLAYHDRIGEVHRLSNTGEHEKENDGMDQVGTIRQATQRNPHGVRQDAIHKTCVHSTATHTHTHTHTRTHTQRQDQSSQSSTFLGIYTLPQLYRCTLVGTTSVTRQTSFVTSTTIRNSPTPETHLTVVHASPHTVKSCMKAAASMTFLVKICRLLYETGISMYVNTKTRLMCDLMGPKKLRLLFEGGFYTRLYGSRYISLKDILGKP